MVRRGPVSKGSCDSEEQDGSRGAGCPLTDATCSVQAKLQARAQSFGPVETEHYVFAAFVPKITFSGK